ncbi:MAG TPA: hypothetical protein VLH39_06225 [Magnetospirillaceae bacterium]|nr:hypothetical protein [Magnetospirillaceae bacterium]
MQLKAPDEAEHGLLETAAQHASRRVPTVAPTATAAEVLRGLVGNQFDAANHIVVLDGNQFRGLLKLEVVLAADNDDLVGDLMDGDAPVVAPGVDQEVAVWTAVRPLSR